MSVLPHALIWKKEAASFTVLRGLADQWLKNHPELDTKRMQKALALTGGVSEIRPNQYKVEGEGGSYTVTVNPGQKKSFCTCEDSRRGNHCKHRLAVALVVMGEKKQPPPPPPAQAS